MKATGKFYIACAGFVALVMSVSARQTRVPAATDYAPALALVPTNHPVVPREASQLWLVPQAKPAFVSDLAQAMQLRAKGDYAKALPVLSLPASQEGALGVYAMYDAAMAMQSLGRIDDARKMFHSVSDRHPIGYLSDAALLGEAQCADLLNDPSSSVPLYETLLKSKATRQDEILWRLGSALRAMGQTERATSLLTRVYYEFPLGEFAPKAFFELSLLHAQPPLASGNDRFKLELARAERLFSAKEYAPARTAFTTLKLHARGDDRELVDLRTVETNYFLKRARDARDLLRPLMPTVSESRKAEALYFHALIQRELGLPAEYTKTVRRLSSEYPTQHWAVDALNNYASYLVVKDQDDQADALFRQLYAMDPKGPYSERAAWKIGWRAFMQEQYTDTTTYFERAASDFPRSDYRPAWLYWAGRAHELKNERNLANERFGLVTADYLNSYYGRLAVKRLGGKVPPPRVVADRAPAPAVTSPAPDHASVIRALISAGFYPHAIAELHYAQKTTGDSSSIQATLAWISHEQGRSETGQTRFTLLRGAITTMRRAYPQFLAAGGEQLPREILSVIYPLEYWDYIRKYAEEEQLDPYLVAALVAQESTFAPDVQSVARAVGLMQLMPATARQQARKLNIPYSSRLLVNPEVNVRMGTSYFADKMVQFGAAHLALASYNAGEGAVRRWMAERPTLDTEEFVDDIPYPETQNYVKRILGTTEDYRRLYKN